MQLKKNLYPWIIWTLGAGFFFYKYLVQVSPSVMTDDLMKAFQVHGAGLGHLSAFYFYAYLIMQVPVGILLDKYSPRCLTSLAILICGISTFVFSQAHSLEVACLSRAMMGAGAAFAAVSCFKLATVWFSPARFAFISGLCMTAAMLGAVGGQAPLALLIQYSGWRSGLQIISLIGIGLGFLYFAVVRDKPVQSTMQTPPQPSIHLRRDLFSVLKNKQTWLLSLYSGLAFAPVSVFGGLWGVPFLQTAYNLPANNAAFAVSWIFVGFAIGAPFFGWLSNFIGRRKPVLFLGSTLAIFCISVVLYTQILSVTGLSVLLFLFGFGTSGFFTSFAMIRELFPLFLTATVLGVMNTFDAVCEALFEPLVGAFLDLNWDGTIVSGVHQFSAAAYQIALLMLPVSLAAALFLLFFIKETYCIPIEEDYMHVHETARVGKPCLQ